MTIKTVNNYVLAGLESVMDTSQVYEDKPKKRVFYMQRHQMNMVAPHSHRYDLLSKVRVGEVINTIWTPTAEDDPEGDAFMVTKMTPHEGGLGNYSQNGPAIMHYKPAVKRYIAGDEYFMHHMDIHSIAFTKGAIVDILEFPQAVDGSYVLEPYINNEIIPLARANWWMFSNDK